MSIPKLKEVSLDSLIEDPKNARTHSDKNLGVISESLKSFGPVRSIVIDKDGIVRAGNGTIEAAKKAGHKKVLVVESDGDTLVAVQRKDWNEQTAKGYALADNRSAELAEWNNDILASLMDELKEAEFELEPIGIDMEFLTDIGIEVPNFEPSGEPPQLDEKSKKVCPECGHVF